MGDTDSRKRCSVRVRLRSDRIEVSLGRGFDEADLAVVRALPRRRWDAERKVWIAPEPEKALGTLERSFGRGRLVATDATDGPEGEDETESGKKNGPNPGRLLLERVRDGLELRGYRRSTRKVYLGHLRRFVHWAVARTPCALRFLFETVLAHPRLPLAVPRPKLRNGVFRRS